MGNAVKDKDLTPPFHSNFVEIHMETTVVNCRQRDSKGHYTKADRGEYHNFPGVDVEYEKPLQPEITIEVDKVTIEESTRQIINYLKENFINNKKLTAWDLILKSLNRINIHKTTCFSKPASIKVRHYFKN